MVKFENLTSESQCDFCKGYFLESELAKLQFFYGVICKECFKLDERLFKNTTSLIERIKELEKEGIIEKSDVKKDSKIKDLIQEQKVILNEIKKRRKK